MADDPRYAYLSSNVHTNLRSGRLLYPRSYRHKHQNAYYDLATAYRHPNSNLSSRDFLYPCADPVADKPANIPVHAHAITNTHLRPGGLLHAYPAAGQNFHPLHAHTYCATAYSHANLYQDTNSNTNANSHGYQIADRSPRSLMACVLTHELRL